MTISEEIAALGFMSLKELREEWRRHYGRVPPPRLSQGLLRMSIAYRIQEKQLGGLKPATKRKLLSLASASPSSAGVKLRRSSSLRPGTKLIREWQGRTHSVTVMEKGFEFEGRWYRSLSEIAREITGAHWSGPRFFGLTSARSKMVPSDARA